MDSLDFQNLYLAANSHLPSSAYAKSLWALYTDEILVVDIPKIDKTIGNREKSILQKSASNKISVFPNPTTNSVFIKTNEVTEKTLHVYNSTGLLLISLKFNDLTKKIDLKDLSAGLYFFKIQQGDIEYSEKIIKY